MKISDVAQDHVDEALALVEDHDYADSIVIRDGEVIQGEARLTAALDLREQGFDVNILAVAVRGDQTAIVKL